MTASSRPVLPLGRACRVIARALLRFRPNLPFGTTDTTLRASTFACFWLLSALPCFLSFAFAFGDLSPMSGTVLTHAARSFEPSRGNEFVRSAGRLQGSVDRKAHLASRNIRALARPSRNLAAFRMPWPFSCGRKPNLPMGTIGLTELLLVGIVFLVVIGFPVAAIAAFLLLRKKPNP